MFFLTFWKVVLTPPPTNPTCILHAEAICNNVCLRCHCCWTVCLFFRLSCRNLIIKFVAAKQTNKTIVIPMVRVVWGLVRLWMFLCPPPVCGRWVLIRSINSPQPCVITGVAAAAAAVAAEAAGSPPLNSRHLMIVMGLGRTCFSCTLHTLLHWSSTNLISFSSYNIPDHKSTFSTVNTCWQWEYQPTLKPNIFRPCLDRRFLEPIIFENA